MRFKEWTELLNEIQYVSFPRWQRVNGILCDAIDFRFEDWKKGYNPERHPNAKTFGMPSPGPYLNSSLSAPLDDNTYLNVIYESRPTTAGPLALATSTDRQISIGMEPLGRPLPRQWMDFAVFYLGNKVVKPPEWPRDAQERGEMAQVEPSSVQAPKIA